MMLRQIYKCIFLLVLLVLHVPNCKAESQDQEIKVALRTIGHEFLLELNDSTSRVMPIEKIDGRYAVQFEKEFSFEPDALLFSTHKVLEASNIQDSYIVEVEKCGTKEVVHSFKASLSDEDKMAPCAQRAMPADCYVFYFTVVENEVTKEADTSMIYIVLLAILILAIVLVGFLYFRKRNVVNASTTPGKTDADLIHIGQFQFDQKGMTLILKAQLIELSSKESDLLALLLSNENKTLKRADILKEVWGDDGDYVGRTLDVFISKLRKKLEADPSLKIVNIRGVGYRFVMN